MDTVALEQQLADIGVMQAGHFVLNSGKHSGLYLNKDAIYPYIPLVQRICDAFASHFRGWNVDLLVGPAHGGIVLAYETAWKLGLMQSRDVKWIYAEKKVKGGLEIRRGYDKLVQGKRVGIVEDILTTGGSVLEVVNEVRHHGGDVASVAAICNRGGVTETNIGDVPNLYSLLHLPTQAWEEADCPLCREERAISTNVGHGVDWLSKHPEYQGR